MSEVVDANVFLRLLTRDDDAKFEACRTLLHRAARGEVLLVTSESVVAEVVYVLNSPSVYQASRSAVAAALRPILRNRGLRIAHKDSILRAVDRFEQTSQLDFEDCLSVEHIRREQLVGIYSYDRDFDRIEGIRRIEP